MNNIKLLTDRHGINNDAPCIVWFYDLNGEVAKVSATCRPIDRISSVKTNHGKDVSGYVHEPCASIEEARAKKAEWLEGHHESLSKGRSLPERLASYQYLYRRRKKAHLNDREHYVYRLLGRDGLPVYIGATCDLSTRMDYHRYRLLWNDVADLTFETFPDKASAYAHEAMLIDKYQPPHNWLGIESKNRVSKLCGIYTAKQIQELRQTQQEQAA